MSLSDQTKSLSFRVAVFLKMWVTVLPLGLSALDPLDLLLEFSLENSTPYFLPGLLPHAWILARDVFIFIPREEGLGREVLRGR